MTKASYSNFSQVKRNEAQAQEAKDASYNFLDPLLPPDDNDAKLAKLLQLTQVKSISSFSFSPTNFLLLSFLLVKNFI